MNQFQEKRVYSPADTATVSASGGSVVGHTALRNLRVCAPFGFVQQPTDGTPMVLLPLANGELVLLGCLHGGSTLPSGEIALQNPAGATIRLKADGSISLNGLIIDKNGQMGGS